MKPRIKTRLTNAVLVLISLLVSETVCRVALKTVLPTVEAKRTRLVGQLSKSPRFQNSVGLPYLLYGPASGYSNIHGRQHNRAGFRGRFVPQKRALGKKRILFLGGSTTYGWKVNRANYTFPAQIRKLLQQKYPGQNFEVINAGLPSGSSAELLTHFHFKYRYFKSIRAGMMLGQLLNPIFKQTTAIGASPFPPLILFLVGAGKFYVHVWRASL